MSYFEVEFRIRVFRFVTLFDFSNLTLNSSSNSTSRMSCRISNSNASSKFLVEIFVSLLYSTSRISLLYSISRISIFDSNFDSSFECKFLDFSCRICRRNFRCLTLFDFSKLIVKFDFSKFVALFDFSNFEFSIRVLDSSALNFEFVLIYSTSRISIRIVVEIVVFVSHSSFEFLIELFNFRRNSAICIALMH